MMTPFVCPYWGTFNQWSEAGYKIKKDSKAEVIFSKSSKVEEKEDGTKVFKTLVSRPWYVYNGEQIEGFEWAPDEAISVNADIEAVLTAKNPAIVHIDNMMPYFDNDRDIINMPRVEVFTNADGYLGALAHELIHWSGHESRLNRDTLVNYHASGNQAFEELVAEIGASILGTELGFVAETQHNSFNYIAGWLTLMSDKKDALKRAAAEAIEAVRYLR
jgi:antirestriction protein ArdC